MTKTAEKKTEKVATNQESLTEDPKVEMKQSVDLVEQISDRQARAVLFKKMAAVMTEVEWIPKRGWNDFHKYNYVQESDVVDHLRKALSKQNLAILPPNIVSREIQGNVALVDIEMSIGCGDTGEVIKGVITTEGQDKGDKKFPKAFASATKYFLMKTFLIPTGDDPEGDIRTDKQAYGANNAKKPSGNTGGGQPTKPQLEGDINSLLQQLTQNGYQGQYVYTLSSQEVGKEFQQLNELSVSDLKKIKTLLSTELQKSTS